MTHPIAKALCLAGAFVGGGTLSQYPEFAQQYTQRLAGQVDALGQVVADFDASALDAGLTRTQALEQMTGTDFLKARQADMRDTFARHVTLQVSLTALREASGLDRIGQVHRLNDVETLQNTWADFQPAVPLTSTGAITGGAGGIAGWALVALLLRVLAWPFKRRPQKTTQPIRHDPPVHRAATYPTRTPRLMGETRP